MCSSLAKIIPHKWEVKPRKEVYTDRKKKGPDSIDWHTNHLAIWVPQIDNLYLLNIIGPTFQGVVGTQDPLFRVWWLHRTHFSGCGGVHRIHFSGCGGYTWPTFQGVVGYTGSTFQGVVGTQDPLFRVWWGTQDPLFKVWCVHMY